MIIMFMKSLWMEIRLSAQILENRGWNDPVFADLMNNDGWAVIDNTKYSVEGNHQFLFHKTQFQRKRAGG
jgi:hypothetical protein